MKTSPEFIYELADNEVLRDVIGYEGLYSVTNFGRVWSQPKLHGRSLWAGFWLKPQAEQTGYVFVTLQKDKKRKTCYIHGLVAKAFCDGFEYGLQVNHKDCIKTNNRWDNLEWITPSENILHSFRNGMSCQAGSRNACSKLDEASVVSIRLLAEAGSLQSEIAKTHGVSRATICNIVKRKTWNHV